jgi:hypothetical protein
MFWTKLSTDALRCRGYLIVSCKRHLAESARGASWQSEGTDGMAAGQDGVFRLLKSLGTHHIPKPNPDTMKYPARAPLKDSASSQLDFMNLLTSETASHGTAPSRDFVMTTSSCVDAGQGSVSARNAA